MLTLATAALIGAAITVAAKGIEAGIFSRKSKLERLELGKPAKYKTDRDGNTVLARPATGLYAEQERLARGGSGYTPSEMASLQAQTTGQVQAAQAQAQAEATRGAAAMGGYGGMTGQAAQQQLGLQQTGQMAVNQGMSAVREQSLQKAAADRLAIQQRIQAAMERDMIRKQFAHKVYTSKSPTDQFASTLGSSFTKGQSDRAAAGTGVGGELDTAAGGTTAPPE